CRAATLPRRRTPELAYVQRSRSSAVIRRRTGAALRLPTRDHETSPGHPRPCVVLARSQPAGREAVSRARYIAVEGPIGVGKTTLARILADELQARMVLEQVDDNPFLRRFYDEPEKAAFQAQLFFLLTRYRQQQELAQQELFRQSLVADYLFAKDHLFAQINLDS